MGSEMCLRERFSAITLIVCVAGIGCFPEFFEWLIRFTFNPEIFHAIGM